MNDGTLATALKLYEDQAAVPRIVLDALTEISFGNFVLRETEWFLQNRDSIWRRQYVVSGDGPHYVINTESRYYSMLNGSSLPRRFDGPDFTFSALRYRDDDGCNSTHLVISPK